jgi:hypothetical protein
VKEADGKDRCYMSLLKSDSYNRQIEESRREVTRGGGEGK